MPKRAAVLHLQLEPKEYRFAFSPFVYNRLLPPKKEDVFLNLNALTAP
jgi:hypothetical protein